MNDGQNDMTTNLGCQEEIVLPRDSRSLKLPLGRQVCQQFATEPRPLAVKWADGDELQASKGGVENV